MLLYSKLQWISIALLFTAQVIESGKYTYDIVQKDEIDGKTTVTSAHVFLSVVLGSGDFGEVYKGTFYGKTLDGTFAFEEVAVKMPLVKENDMKKEYNLQLELLEKLKKQNGKQKIIDSFQNYGGVGRLYQVIKAPSNGFDGIAMQLFGLPLTEANFALFCNNYPRLFWKHVAPQMAACIVELHSADFVHRDVKPENFLFGSGTLKRLVYINDFGFSIFIDSTGVRDGKVGQVGTLDFMSIDIINGKEYVFKDDYVSLIYTWIYLLKGRSLGWLGKKDSEQIKLKGTYSCETDNIPGGKGLDKFLNWARCTKDKALRHAIPVISEILAFITEIQMEVKEHDVDIELSELDGADLVYKIPILKWDVYPTITDSYIKPDVEPIQRTTDPSAKLYMRLEGIVAQVSPKAPSAVLPIDFALQFSPQQHKTFVSLLPGITELIAKHGNSAFECVIFTETKEMAELVEKYGFFRRYNVTVITTATMLTDLKPNDIILENSKLQIGKAANNVNLIDPMDVESCSRSPADKEKVFNGWRNKIVNILESKAPGMIAGIVGYFTSFIWR